MTNYSIVVAEHGHEYVAENITILCDGGLNLRPLSKLEHGFPAARPLPQN